MRAQVRRAASLFTEPGRRRFRGRLPGLIAQWLWWLPWVPHERVGLEDGPFTWLRESRHARLDRPWTICILEYPRSESRFGRLMACWINDNSRCFRAVVNREVESADIVWVHTQDPLDLDAKRAISHALAKAPGRAAVINHPDHYNAYHEPRCFERLRAAGVGVPRTEPELQVGEPVVYKAIGQQMATKYLDTYSGTRPGFRAFEFIDARIGDEYRRYRAHYMCGFIRPSGVLVSYDWNVHLAASHDREFTFVMPLEECEQLELLAKTLGLDYFAVDYLRKGGDGEAIFVDINVYPTIGLRNLGLRSYGYSHTFDIRARVGIEEPMGCSTPEFFDRAFQPLVHRSGNADRLAVEAKG